MSFGYVEDSVRQIVVEIMHKIIPGVRISTPLDFVHRLYLDLLNFGQEYIEIARHVRENVS
jgi:hypothetical protein